MDRVICDTAEAASTVVIGGPDPSRILVGLPLPEFQVLDPVIGSVPVHMMNVLVGEEKPSELLLHDESVLKDVSILRGIRVVTNLDPQITIAGSSRSAEVPAVPTLAREWMSLEMPLGTVGLIADRSFLATATFTDPVRDESWINQIGFSSSFPAPMAVDVLGFLPLPCVPLLEGNFLSTATSADCHRATVTHFLEV